MDRKFIECGMVQNTLSLESKYVNIGVCVYEIWEGPLLESACWEQRIHTLAYICTYCVIGIMKKIHEVLKWD